MSDKTNKELTVELTSAYIQAWSSNGHVSPLCKEECVEILHCFKDAIDAIDDFDREKKT